MIMLPAFRAVADQLGKPPICMVSVPYASIFDGVSYVRPWVVNVHWWGGIGEARRVAERKGFHPVVVKWWDEPGATPPPPPDGAKLIKVKIRGEIRQIAENEWDSYQASQWRYAGFSVADMMNWPLVFDRRNPQREEALAKRVFKTGKPKLLAALSSDGTSPFWHRDDILSVLRVEFPGHEIIDIASVRAFRIFDLLGIYDRAAGLVTSDTATLHLAPASPIPYVAFINDGGSGSIPRGNCVASIRYRQSKEMPVLREAMQALKGAMR